MRFFVAVMFFALNGSAASPASVESWADLASIINDKQVTNIDDLLANLPADYTKGYTLIYRTRALNQESVSPRRPRVLLFGQNAKFVLAYNSHSTGGKARPGEVEAIETLEFDDVSGESRLREVVFKSGEVPDLTRVAINPDRCLACHAASSNPRLKARYTVRGLWDPYNSWAGVYGSLSRKNVDFIKLDTAEYRNFQEFRVEEKPNNPRYDFLPLTTENLSSLQQHKDVQYDSSTMDDALTFSNGYSSHPNQILGMYLADYNFRRVGNILAELVPVETRAAFQYLVRGLTIDEGTFVQLVDDQTNGTVTNSTHIEDKKYTCLNNITSFLPYSMPKISFDEFADRFLDKLRADYVGRKALVEVDNMGLSQKRPGHDPRDPYDEDRDGRKLIFDSVNSGTHHFCLHPGNLLFCHRNQSKRGYWGGTALFYLFYLMDLPSQDFNTAITRGSNVPIDSEYVLSGSTSISYGNAARCFTLDGKPKGSCDSGGADEFFTQYLPKSFYQNLDGSALDPHLDQLTTCDELASHSKDALTSYFAN